MAHTDERHLVPLILLAQFTVSLGLAAVFGLLLGRGTAVALMAGGMAAVIPNTFLAARLLGPRAAAGAKALLRAAWLGEIGKLCLTILLFAAIFALLKPGFAPAVFGGYVAAQLMVVAVPLVVSGPVRNGAKSES